jgi:hypothetical protein
LERALTSYIRGTARAHREIEYTVFDDSKDPAARRASFEVARKIRRQFNVDVRFAGYEERAAFVRRLDEHSHPCGEHLKPALLRSEGYTLGQNRNALLLDCVGGRVLCADDDTVCDVALPPAEEGGIKLCAGRDPADFWCFQDPAEARASVEFVETDLLTAHERLLGRRVSELCRETEIANGTGCQPDIELSERVRRVESAVRITFNGLVGDCAWGSPFGLWHAPMGYLAFEGPSLERLVSSKEAYRHAIESRQVLRVTNCPVLADVSFSMLTSYGLDGSELLPPNFPTHRGQDLIFGQVLWKCFTDAVFCHVPLALTHDPVPARRFWPGEITRSAAGVDLCRLMIEAIGLCCFREHDVTAPERLKALGRHILGLAELPAGFLGELLMERLHESNRRFENTLKERAQKILPRAPHYSQDVTEFFDRLRKSETREDYWIPLDLSALDGPPGAEGRVRRALKEFGELLECWPAIIEFARTLRDNGGRLSVPV